MHVSIEEIEKHRTEMNWRTLLFEAPVLQQRIEKIIADDQAANEERDLEDDSETVLIDLLSSTDPLVRVNTIEELVQEAADELMDER